MAVTVSLYNHTARLFASGANSSTDSYRVMLCTAATFNAADTTLAGIVKTEVATGNGYTAAGALLASVAVTTVTTNDAKFDANDVSWTVPAAGTLTASYGILYNDTDTNDPPVAFIDFDGAQTAVDGSIFQIIWNVSGIFTFSVT
jgi:hypothetical protein